MRGMDAPAAVTLMQSHWIASVQSAWKDTG